MKKPNNESLPSPSHEHSLPPPFSPSSLPSENCEENTLPEEETRQKETIGPSPECMASLEEQIKRMQADFENYKRHKDEEWEQYRKYAGEKLLIELVAIQDNLERAIKAAQETKNLKALIEGLQLVLRQIQCTLMKEGVKEIPAVGCLFDPCVHQAVQKEICDEVPDETVTEEFQRGYSMGDRLLRPSLVKVSRKPHTVKLSKEEE